MHVLRIIGETGVKLNGRMHLSWVQIQGGDGGGDSSPKDFDPSPNKYMLPSPNKNMFPFPKNRLTYTHVTQHYTLDIYYPLKSLVTGPSLLDNCYLGTKFHKKIRVNPPPPPPLNGSNGSSFLANYFDICFQYIIM